MLEALNAIYEAASAGTPAAEPEETEAPAAEPEAPVAAVGEIVNEGTVWATAAQGFAGPVSVKVTLDGLTIKSIKIGDEQFSETDGLGANALDPLFQLQFVDKTLPLAEGDVEAISGATITTDAVLEALNAIYEAASADTAVIGEADAPTEIEVAEPTEAPAAEPEATEAPAAEVTNEGTVWTTAAQGFAGPVAVKVTLDGLTIKSIKIGDEQFSETDGLGANALDPLFQLQFVDKTLPLAEGDVEAISGATITTDAVLEALNAIYEAASADTAVIGGADGPTAIYVTGAEGAEEPESTEAPAAEVINEGTVWTTAAQGFAGPVSVKVTLDGLTIKSIKIGDEQFSETDGLGANALDPLFQLQFVDKTLPLAEGDVEAISGATITTDAVLDALSAIYEAAK